MTRTKTRALANWPNNAVSVLDFGADPTGTNSSQQAFIDCIAENDNVIVPDGTYIDVGGININRSNVRIDLTTARIEGVGNQFIIIGTPNNSGATPPISNITIKGGEYIGAMGADVRAFTVRGASNVLIQNCVVRNPGNGGITVEAGSYDTTIRDCKVLGTSGHHTIRGIWMNGSNADDYQSYLMDKDTITRNSTAFPTIQADRVTIDNCEVATGAYNIYSMNTNHLTVINCYIHDFGGARGISVNTYSPNTIISNNIFENNYTSSGVMITQVSDGTIISNNIFKGDYGGGRMIQVQYLAEALISDNQFLASGSQGIDINTGATAIITGNYFCRPTSANTDQRAIYHLPVDRNVAGGVNDIGAAAVDVPGLVVQNNIFKNWGAGLYQTTQLLTANNNAPGIRSTVFTGNSYVDDPDESRPASSGPYYSQPVDNDTQGAGTVGTNTIDACYRNNTVTPRSMAYKNRITRAGDKSKQNFNYIDDTTALSVVRFKFISGTEVEGSRVYGPDMVCSGTSNISGGGLEVTPRAPYGVSSGGSVPNLVAAFPTANGEPWFASYVYTETRTATKANTYTIQFRDKAGNEVDTRTAAAIGQVVLLLFISDSK